MTKEQIDKLLLTGELPGDTGKPALIETHISWVLLCDRYVYKIKRPILYSFLDFSTLEKRKYYCEREIELNKRLTENIYLDVEPAREKLGQFFIGGDEGDIIDYAVRMHKLDNKRQMDILLLNDKVSREDIKNLAEKIASFHKNTTIIYQKDFLDIQKKFIDLELECDFLEQYLKGDSGNIIRHAIATSNAFMEKHHTLLQSRLKDGFFRDCHGDLHSRNIFLLASPQPFDCIEFNDDFRQIDVLNEIAFLCMDLDSFGRQDLADLFLKYYNDLFSTMKTAEDQLLFIYYKSYRSNIRAKVNSLRARSAKDETERTNALAESGKYLHLMNRYIKMLDQAY
jgi:uncharacterized protein